MPWSSFLSDGVDYVITVNRVTASLAGSGHESLGTFSEEHISSKYHEKVVTVKYRRGKELLESFIEVTAMPETHKTITR